MMIRGLLLIGFFLPLPAFAQSNEACDAACPVPCYFGSCSPAKATYERALAQCDIEQLDAVAKLYRGTRSATQAEEVLARLRSQTVGRIGVTPNDGTGIGVNSCAEFSSEDACSKVTVPAGFRCTVQGGLAVLLQETAPTPVVTPAPFVSQGCRGLIAPAGTRCDLDPQGNPYFVTISPSQVPPAPSSAQPSGTFGISSSSWLNGSPGSPGSVFREGVGLPEMVVIPSGSYLQGSPVGEEGRDDDEGPQRRVMISRPFALGRTEVTFDQWRACVSGGGCRSNASPNDRGWGRGNRPVINVSWADAQEYVSWLNESISGSPYRLPSESEWEYGARAGTTTPFSTGTTISTGQANYDGNHVYGSGRKGLYPRQSVAVGSFAPNGYGLHDVHGNVWEWVEDCYAESYNSVPSDGRSHSTSGCSLRVLRGGSWYNNPRFLRSANRGWVEPEDRDGLTGFRVARTLTP